MTVGALGYDSHAITVPHGQNIFRIKNNDLRTEIRLESSDQDRSMYKIHFYDEVFFVISNLVLK